MATPRESDHEFLAACGLSGADAASQAYALRIRNTLQSDIAPRGLVVNADTRLFADGLFRREDSLDLVELVMEFEDLFAGGEPLDFREVFDVDGPDLTVKELIRRMLQRRNSHHSGSR